MGGDHRGSKHRKDEDRKDRKRDHDRDRKDRHKRRDSRSRSKSKSRSRSPHEAPEEPRVDLTTLLTNTDRLKAQQELELMFMRKREKIEQERQAKKRKEYKEEKEKKEEKKEEIDNDDELAQQAFDDDDLEMEVEVTKDSGSESEEDPLDAYMATIEKQVKPEVKVSLFFLYLELLHRFYIFIDNLLNYLL